MSGQYNDELINELTTFFIPRRKADPLFSAYLSATVNNVTGDGTIYTIINDIEIVDRNGDYNPATGIFMAPVIGQYHFDVVVNLLQCAAAHTALTLVLVTSNRNYRLKTLNPGAVTAASLSVQASFDCDLDAADTAYVTVLVAGGAKVVDVYGEVTNVYTGFCGHLLI